MTVLKWIIGVCTAALAAGLVALISGAIVRSASSAGQRAWMKVRRHGPLSIDVTSAFHTFATELFSADRAGGWFIPQSVEELTYPTNWRKLNEDDGWEQWARELGGLPARTSLVSAVIQGRSAAPVVLTGLKVRVLDRAPAPPGSVIVLSAGGPMPTRCFEVNLDSDPPGIRFTLGDFAEDGDREIAFPYKVSDIEPEYFLISAYTQKYDCKWVVELSWSFDGRHGVAVIDDQTIHSERWPARNRRFTTLGTANSLN